MCFNVIQTTARKLAYLLMDSPHQLATQHLKGDWNIVSDLLSFVTSREKHHPLAKDDPDDDTCAG